MNTPTTTTPAPQITPRQMTNAALATAPRTGGQLLTIANKQWMNRPADERFTTLGALAESVNARRRLSRATDVRLADMRLKVEGEGQLVANSSVAPSVPSHWAFGQLAGLVGAPANYLRNLNDPELVARNVNRSLELAEKARETMKVMTVLDEDGGDYGTMQAVTSKTYGRIWDADCVAAVQRIVERSNGKFTNPLDWSKTPSGLYASDHDVFMFMIDGGSMVDGGGERDQLHRGFIVWNSETGAKTFGLMTFLFRVVCGNHLIFGAQNVTRLLIKHTSGGPGRFDTDAMPALEAYANESEKPVQDAITKAKGIRLITLVNLPGQTVATNPLDSVDWIKSFAKKYGFTAPEIRSGIQFARAEEGQCDNVWDMLNGITASARAIEHMDTRLDLEKRAGALMNLTQP